MNKGLKVLKVVATGYIISDVALWAFIGVGDMLDKMANGSTAYNAVAGAYGDAKQKYKNYFGMKN